MEALIDNHARILEELDWLFDRNLSIDWEDRLIGLTGARGVGKTTYLIHHIKMLNVSFQIFES